MSTGGGATYPTTRPTGSANPAPRRRPKNRKQQILLAAAAQFWRLGYDHVSMADVAAEVGIRPSALYRHFSGKRELLAAVMNQALDEFDDVRLESADGLHSVTQVAVRRREFGVLWERESGHLHDDERRALRARLRAIAARIAGHLGTPGPSGPERISGPEADMKAWAMMSVLDSLSHHKSGMDSSVLCEVLVDAITRLRGAPIEVTESQEEHTEHPGSGPLRPVSRREQVLSSAMRLFGEHGYPAVGVIDIGTDLGITGASIYNHFASKAELLVAALNRGNETLWLGLHDALRHSTTAEQALGSAVRNYTDFALKNPEVVAILIAEVINLPTEHRQRLVQAQQEYVTEWVALLRATRPELDEPLARILVHAALGIVNSLTRIHHLRRFDSVNRDVAELVHAVLGAPVP